MRLVEEEAEVGKHDPEFLPAVAVLELSQKISRELVLEKQKGVPQGSLTWYKMFRAFNTFCQNQFFKKINSSVLQLTSFKTFMTSSLPFRNSSNNK